MEGIGNTVKPRILPVLLGAWAGCGLWVADLRANPVNGVVAAGSATIGSSGSSLNVFQSTDRAIINWKSFGIAAGESTTFHFTGPAGANSAVLNRVTTPGSLSQLNGLLQ